MAAQVVIYLMTFCLAPLGVSFFALLCAVAFVLILLPQYLGLKGIWLAVPAAELLTAGVALWAFLCLPKREPKRK